MCSTCFSVIKNCLLLSKKIVVPENSISQWNISRYPNHIYMPQSIYHHGSIMNLDRDLINDLNNLDHWLHTWMLLHHIATVPNEIMWLYPLALSFRIHSLRCIGFKTYTYLAGGHVLKLHVIFESRVNFFNHLKSFVWLDRYFDLICAANLSLCGFYSIAQIKPKCVKLCG